MKITACAITDTGKVRANNEDNFYLNGIAPTEQELSSGVIKTAEYKEGFVAAVCDGMGGEEDGEFASKAAVQTIAAARNDLLTASENRVMAMTTQCMNGANEVICDEMMRCGKRIGTTAAMLICNSGGCYVANIGDSRIYGFSGGILKQLSVDHTEVQSQLDNGVITKEKAKTAKNRHILTQHLGIHPDEMIIQPHFAVLPKPQNGDIFLLCSDGLTDVLPDEDIAAVLSNGTSAAVMAKKLIDTALERGGPDNTTVEVICFEKESAEPSASPAASAKGVARIIVAAILIYMLGFACAYMMFGGKTKEATTAATAESAAAYSVTTDEASSEYNSYGSTSYVYGTTTGTTRYY